MSENKKTILFLSQIDFKEKSIQVIRKTPEYFVKYGWEVHYVVASDKSKSGDYYYEKEINPEGVNVYRFSIFFEKLKDKISNNLLLTVVGKISLYLMIFQLFSYGRKILKKQQIDVVYGYETIGVLAVWLLKLFSFTKKFKTVSRFQGTWITQYFKEKKYLKLILNIDKLIALKVRNNLAIMTDDGTQGDFALKKLNKKQNFKFWVNGVDNQFLEKEKYIDLKEKYVKNNETVILSVSRLISWKRIDRTIEIVDKIVNQNNCKNFIYLIIGEGPEKESLEKMVKLHNLENYIQFVGSVQNQEIKKYLNFADIFISMYDLSNVGNPLLEAISANCCIFTLNNGDTGNWIKHKANGFIYEIDDNLFNNVARDIISYSKDNDLQKFIKKNVELTNKEKLWNWDERMKTEVECVTELLNT